MSGPEAPRAVIFGCGGLILDDDERRLFAEAQPLGFILFERNCRDSEQVRALVACLREAVGRADAPVLIDQEGGRVRRLKPPKWRDAPAASRFAELYQRDPARGEEAAWLNSRLMAHELSDLGITVDCAPVLDVPAPGGHEIIGDRAYGKDADSVAALGAAVCDGLLSGGVLPVIKHIPGHGRAGSDSHQELPALDTPHDALSAQDFRPFRALNAMPWAMTAHVLYRAIDADAPATISRRVVEEIIRGEIGFDGLLLSDDLGMQALSGGFAERTGAALSAGCDVALHCSGIMAEMTEIAAVAPLLSDAASARLARGETLRRDSFAPPPADMTAQFDALMAAAGGG